MNYVLNIIHIIHIPTSLMIGTENSQKSLDWILFY